MGKKMRKSVLLYLLIMSVSLFPKYTFSGNLGIEKIKYEEWKLLRMQPTKTPSSYQHSSYISEFKLLMTIKKTISGFEEKKKKCF